MEAKGSPQIKKSLEPASAAVPEETGVLESLRAQAYDTRSYAYELALRLNELRGRLLGPYAAPNDVPETAEACNAVEEVRHELHQTYEILVRADSTLSDLERL